jgi:hypothetical protein
MMPSRSRSLQLIAVTCWLAWLGCDQFATVGIRDPEKAGVGAPSHPEGDASTPIDHDAAMPTDAGVTTDAGAAADAGAECVPAAVADCNPVTNEGCEASLMMQCAVNFAATLTGYCIFNSGGPPPALGGACLNTGITESCAPTATCVAGQCRKLCLCDADCGAAQCCTDPLESTGFKVCGGC